MEEVREREVDQVQERELGMQQKHRQHIYKNIEKLIRITDYNVIMTETVRRGLLSPVMRRNIEVLQFMGPYQSDEEVQLDRSRKYFEKITKRGPTAYAELKAILRSLKYVEALRILEEIDPPNNEFVSLSRANSHKSTDIVDNRVSEPPDDQPSVSKPIVSSSALSPRICNSTIFHLQVLHNDADGPLKPFVGELSGQNREVIKSTRIHTDKVLDVYTMKSKQNRGVLFIVNIIDFPNPEKRRNGAELDGESLIHIFREIGFTTFYYTNLNQVQFFKTLYELTSSDYVRDTECFVMVLMTHGERVDEVDKVFFSDDSVVNVKEIINHFQPAHCPHLLHKPKVLIFPFCRGEIPDRGQYLNHSLSTRMMSMRIQTDGKPFDNVPTLSDILVCYATMPGFQTHRDPDEGSWYIQQFCDTMAKHAHDTSLEDILKKTQSLVGNMRTGQSHLQTGAFDNLGFNKKLYFNPGFFAD